MVLNTVVAMFSEYCAKPFTVEPVKVVYEEPEYAPVDRSLHHAEADNSNGASTQQSDKKDAGKEEKQLKNKEGGDISMNGWTFPIVKEYVCLSIYLLSACLASTYPSSVYLYLRTLIPIYLS